MLLLLLQWLGMDTNKKVVESRRQPCLSIKTSLMPAPRVWLLLLGAEFPKQAHADDTMQPAQWEKMAHIGRERCVIGELHNLLRHRKQWRGGGGILPVADSCSIIAAFPETQ